MLIVLSDIAVPAAIMLDLFIGDPRWLPHPIRWMGAGISFLEPFFRKWFKQPFYSGALFAATLIILAWLLTWFTVRVAYDADPAVGFAVETVLIFYCISIRSLRDAAMHVQKTLERGTLAQARAAVAWIVGRETKHLDRSGVSRAAVETVAENLVDGVISPVFYAVLGGAPLAMAFKMISTLDSMVGYRNETYREFGTVGARLDDMANYVPARMAIPIISMAAQILFGRGKQSIRLVCRDGRLHTSPNAGLPEAAFAGALGVELGGPNYYHGILVDKPFIGSGLSDVDSRHIAQACSLMVLSSILWGVVLVSAALIIGYFATTGG